MIFKFQRWSHLNSKKALVIENEGRNNLSLVNRLTFSNRRLLLVLFDLNPCTVEPGFILLCKQCSARSETIGIEYMYMVCH